MKFLYLSLLLTSVAFANGNQDQNSHDKGKPRGDRNISQQQKVITAVDFGGNNYSTDYDEAAQAPGVDGGECHGSLGIGIRSFQIGGAGPSSFCMKIKSARDDREAASKMHCTAPHELNKSGDAWVPNSCMAEKHRLFMRAAATSTGASEEANRRPGFLTRVWRIAVH